MGFTMVSSYKQLSPLLVLLSCINAQNIQFQREVEDPLNCIPGEQSRNGDTILVTYKGFLADGTVFDSNEGGEPIKFKLGSGQVIKGWEKGLVKTCPGEKVVMIIPPELGYGARGQEVGSFQEVPLCISSL